MKEGASLQKKKLAQSFDGTQKIRQTQGKIKGQCGQREQHLTAQEMLCKDMGRTMTSIKDEQVHPWADSEGFILVTTTHSP